MFYFDNNPQYFEVKKEVPFYLQKDLNTDEFEQQYLNLRMKEDRVIVDSQLRDLPRVYLDHPWHHEWKIRARSAARLIKRLKSERPKVVVEVGCGNGWLVNEMQRILRVPVIGVDVNKKELAQGANTFDGWSHFVFGDILSDAFQGLKPNAIVLAASAQYFPDLRFLITRLRSMVNDNGTIHIIDTPFYKQDQIADAKSRSEEYFLSQGSPGMAKYYFHHDIDVFSEFNAKFLYRPNVISRLLNKSNSPFPWVRIRKS